MYYFTCLISGVNPKEETKFDTKANTFQEVKEQITKIFGDDKTLFIRVVSVVEVTIDCFAVDRYRDLVLGGENDKL